MTVHPKFAASLEAARANADASDAAWRAALEATPEDQRNEGFGFTGSDLRAAWDAMNRDVNKLNHMNRSL